MILNCLSKLDWLGLTLEKTAQDQKLSDALAVAEGSLQDLEKEAHRLAQLVMVVGNIKDTVHDLEVLEKRRVELPVRVQALRSDDTAKSGFSTGVPTWPEAPRRPDQPAIPGQPAR